MKSRTKKILNELKAIQNNARRPINSRKAVRVVARKTQAPAPAVWGVLSGLSRRADITWVKRIPGHSYFR